MGGDKKNDFKIKREYISNLVINLLTYYLRGEK